MSVYTRIRQGRCIAFVIADTRVCRSCERKAARPEGEAVCEGEVEALVASGQNTRDCRTMRCYQTPQQRRLVGTCRRSRWMSIHGAIPVGAVNGVGKDHLVAHPTNSDSHPQRRTGQGFPRLTLSNMSANMPQHPMRRLPSRPRSHASGSGRRRPHADPSPADQSSSCGCGQPNDVV